MRRYGLTTIFGNPGSTEIAFLTDLPSDMRFVLGLHEGSVVGMASGYALARGEPAFVNLHTAAGLGNAINAIANARDCRAPLVILVGQQDRRQMAFEPFLTGRALERLAGEYPVWRQLPTRPQDVPGAIARAYHEAMAARGPALVVVPMGDWLEPADELAAGSPARVLRPSVGGARARSRSWPISSRAPRRRRSWWAPRSAEDWHAVVALAERLRCPVWQEPFIRRVGFPQDHPLFAGHLHWQRRLMHDVLAAYDVVLAVGTNAFRAYIFDEPVALVGPDTRVAVLTADPAEAHRSPCELAVVAPVGAACQALVGAVARASHRQSAGAGPPAGAAGPARAGRAAASRRMSSTRWPRGCPTRCCWSRSVPRASPSSTSEFPVRVPFGYLSTANGCLGFGLAGSIGLRMGLPDRPVVAVLGDGSTMYAIQALWSAARYGVGVLLVVLANGRYAVMDGLARRAGGAAAWPAFESVDIAGDRARAGMSLGARGDPCGTAVDARRGDPEPRRPGRAVAPRGRGGGVVMV